MIAIITIARWKSAGRSGVSLRLAPSGAARRREVAATGSSTLSGAAPPSPRGGGSDGLCSALMRMNMSGLFCEAASCEEATSAIVSFELHSTSLKPKTCKNLALASCMYFVKTLAGIFAPSARSIALISAFLTPILRASRLKVGVCQKSLAFLAAVCIQNLSFAGF